VEVPRVPRREAMNDYRLRVTIEVTEEQMFKLQRYIPWGIRRMLFSTIIDDLLEVIEKSEKGPELLGAILSKSIRIFHETNSVPMDSRREEAADGTVKTRG
jgi:hypothetical protein